MTENDNSSYAQTDETVTGEATTPEMENDAGENDTFPREYVEKLRAEAKDHRKRAEAAHAERDKLAARLHVELVKATGKLQDPRDLPIASEHLDNDEALHAAIDALLEDRPHLKARTVGGDVGQGQREKAQPFSLIDALKRL